MAIPIINEPIEISEFAKLAKERFGVAVNAIVDIDDRRWRTAFRRKSFAECFQHQSLAAGRWFLLSLAEQLGNSVSEVKRAIRARHDD